MKVRMRLLALMLCFVGLVAGASPGTGNAGTNQDATPSHSPEIDNLVQGGKQRFYAGDWEQAEKIFDEVLKKFPKNQAALFYSSLFEIARGSGIFHQCARQVRGLGLSASTKQMTQAQTRQERTFKLDVGLVIGRLSSLQGVGVLLSYPHVSAQAGLLMRDFFNSLGLDLELGKTLWVEDRTGAITIQASDEDLKRVELGVMFLNTPRSGSR
jgi:hypothetical protein